MSDEHTITVALTGRELLLLDLLIVNGYARGDLVPFTFPADAATLRTAVGKWLGHTAAPVKPRGGA